MAKGGVVQSGRFLRWGSGPGCILALLLLLGCPAGAQPSSGAEDLVRQVQQLLAEGATRSVPALAERPADLGWFEHRTTESGPWRAALLSLPGRPGEAPAPAIVFHAFHTCQSIGDHVHRLVETPGAWRIGPEILETDTLGCRVRDHRLTVRFDLPRHGVAIRDEVTLERTREDAGMALLRLSSDMKVDSVTLAGKPFPVETCPGAIAFRPPADRRFTLTLAYHGTVNHPGSDYVTEGEVVLDSYWYPHIARLPARHGIAVTVPEGWRVMATGNLLERRERPDGTTFSYRNELPTSYFTLDAGPYQVTRREVDGRTLACYELRSDPERARRALDELEKSLRFFETTFGKYPYRTYSLVETLLPFPALEAYSFATFQTGMFGAVAHEVSHTWWGGIIPNPYTRTLWNESFASYSEGLFARRDRSAGRRALRGMHGEPDRGRGLLAAYPVPLSRAFDSMNAAHSNVGYDKGGQVLAMLEDLLGTPVMLRCLRTFVSDHPTGEAADWEEFTAVVRRVTGQDYGWFFDQWLQRSGVPVVRLAGVCVGRSPVGYLITGTVAQAGNPYRLRLPLTLETADGRRILATVDARAAAASFCLETAAPPSRLLLDPDGNVLLAGAPLPDGEDPLVFTFPERDDERRRRRRP
jgi:aminopeptidase N